jgi:hypothetical protein
MCNYYTKNKNLQTKMIYSRTARNKRLLGYLVNVFPSKFYGYFARDIMI